MTPNEDSKRLDFLFKQYGNLHFMGLKADRVSGGSILKEYWQVDLGHISYQDGTNVDLQYEANTPREAIDKARKAWDLFCAEREAQTNVTVSGSQSG